MYRRQGYTNCPVWRKRKRSPDWAQRNPGPPYRYGDAAPGFRWRSTRATVPGSVRATALDRTCRIFSALRHFPAYSGSRSIW